MHFAYNHHNPGNLRPSKDAWQGQTGVYDAGPSGVFLTFDSAVNGIRAVARTIYNYPRIYGVRTLRAFFRTYAPTGDGANDPDGYAKFVAKRMGIDADKPVDFTSYEIIRAMLPAIFRMETGEDPAAYYDAATYDAGIAATGLVKVPSRYTEETHDPKTGERVAGKSSTEGAAKTGLIGSALGAVGSAFGAVAAFKEPLVQIAALALIALLFGGGMFLFWLIGRNRRQDRARSITGAGE